MSTSKPTHFAFYVSSHGFGHCTRASAVTTALLGGGHKVTLVTNAPPGPFTAVLEPSATNAHLNGNYAAYRKRDVDPGMVQPKAYDVARQGTVDLLTGFMARRKVTIKEEVDWIKAAGVEAVLSDATFLGCAAGAKAGVPAIIISNFAFDSCFSYLSHPTPASALIHSDDPPEPPVPHSVLDPLVAQVVSDYCCASLLLRLPGAIPMPAFDTDAPWPSGTWVTDDCAAFTGQIEQLLSRNGADVPCALEGGRTSEGKLPPGVTAEFVAAEWPANRAVVDVPLVVRPPKPDVYTPQFRTELLSSMGVPVELHNHRILLVSFGGQNIPRPRSRPPTPLSSPLLRATDLARAPSSGAGGKGPASAGMARLGSLQDGILGSPVLTGSPTLAPPPARAEAVGLLPPGWIALVCGMKPGNALGEALPPNFFGAPLDCHVPDLTATSDVVLGKLGYGTCSEALSTATAMVYVPRPLFIEEHGLRRLMEREGAALALQRNDFEAGRWAVHVLEAWERGGPAKEEARRRGREEGQLLASGAGAAEVIRDEIEKFLAGL